MIPASARGLSAFAVRKLMSQKDAVPEKSPNLTLKRKHESKESLSGYVGESNKEEHIPIKQLKTKTGSKKSQKKFTPRADNSVNFSIPHTTETSCLEIKAIFESEEECAPKQMENSTVKENGHPQLPETPPEQSSSDRTFAWLLYPVKQEEFYSDYWQQKPLHIFRGRISKYYKGLFSCHDFENMMKKNRFEYETHIDVLKYEEGERVYQHPASKVISTIVWEEFKDGFSIRHKAPQTYHEPLWNLCSLLQEHFGSYVGVNMYLTPPGSQGFPPHYDDIEAFILQLEGKKNWKIYQPRTEDEFLARLPSRDFKEEEIGEVYMEVELQAGDLLYLPRGFIHQARSDENTHSLHVTLSTHQLNTLGDFLLAALPAALEKAIETNPKFRKSMPNDYLDYIGPAFTDSTSSKRADFHKTISQLAAETLSYMDIDQAGSKIALNFMHGSMPPFLDRREKMCSTHENGSRWHGKDVALIDSLDLDTRVRLIRKRAVWLDETEDSAKLYHTFDNSKAYQEVEMTFFDMDEDTVAIFKFLLKSYPKFVRIGDIPVDSEKTKTDFIQALFSNGLIMTEEPLSSQE